MRIVKALKKLAVALGCAETTAAVTGKSIAEVLEFIAENLPEATE